MNGSGLDNLPKRSRPPHILLVEDSATNRELIECVLGDAGARVVSVSNGRLGVEAARCHDFDLILMDIQMPVMDGFSATRLIRRRGLAIPIIALTAHAMRSDELKCLEAGCTAYLRKPVDSELLVRMVRKLLAEATDPPRLEPDSKSATTQCAGADSGGVPVDCRAQARLETPIASSLPIRPEFQPIIKKFLERLHGSLDRMKRSHATEDWNQLLELGHWLKGTAGTIGFDCFTEPARRVERLAREHNRSGMSECILELTALARRIVVSHPSHATAAASASKHMKYDRDPNHDSQQSPTRR